jgi:hypothetical protein
MKGTIATQSVAEHLAQLEALNDEMLQLAGENEWSMVRELDTRQQQLAKSLFQTPIPADQRPAVHKLIQKLLTTNRIVTEQATASREKIVVLSNTIHKGRRAVTAYQSHG